MQTSFDPLWRRLLAGGVRRRSARRYLAELKDHLDDLIAEERRAVRDPHEAETQALRRLGSFEMLADAMIERREFQAWGRKAPVTVYLIAPVLALASFTILVVAGVVVAVKQTRSATSPGAVPEWLSEFATGMMFFSHAILPVLLGWVLGAIAVRSRSAPLWPVCGIVALAALDSLLHPVLTFPTATTHGEVSTSPDGISAFLILAGIAALPYAVLLLWRATRERLAA